MPQSQINLDEQNDETLVSLTIAGNQLAYHSLIKRLETKIMAFLLKRCNSHSDAQDILQETFIAAYRNLNKFDTSKQFSSWLFGIARNQANTHFRKIKPTPEPSKISDLFDHATPLSNTDETEQVHIFWKEAKRILSADEFDTLWLRYQENLSLNEIADTLNKTLSNVKILLFRARKSLATSTILAEQHFSASSIAI